MSNKLCLLPNYVLFGSLDVHQIIVSLYLEINWWTEIFNVISLNYPTGLWALTWWTEGLYHIKDRNESFMKLKRKCFCQDKHIICKSSLQIQKVAILLYIYFFQDCYIIWMSLWHFILLDRDLFSCIIGCMHLWTFTRSLKWEPMVLCTCRDGL